MLSRRNFFGMLGGAAAAVPVAELQPVGAVASALEVRRDSRYILVVRYPFPLKVEARERIIRNIEEALQRQKIDNVTTFVLDGDTAFDCYRLDPLHAGWGFFREGL